MHIVQRGAASVQYLLSLCRGGYGKCPHCGSTLTKKNGTYKRDVRDMGGIRTVTMQRHFCHVCHRTWTDEAPEVAPRKWHARRVIRKAVEQHVVGVALRICADWATAEITGKGRTFQWDILARLPWWGRAPEPEPEIAVSHTTV